MLILLKKGAGFYMKPGGIRFVISIVLCIALCAGAVSAIEGYGSYYPGKQSILQSYQTSMEKPVPGTGGSLSGLKPVFIGNLPRIVRVGDTLNLNVYGTIAEGEKFSVEIRNGQFSTPGSAFAFNVTGLTLPGDMRDIDLLIGAQPVSWLRAEYHEEGEIRGMECSDPDAAGKITMTAHYSSEEAETKDYFVVRGTPESGMTTMNLKLEGTSAATLTNPTIRFHIQEVEKGSFTIIISIGGSERLRQTIFVF